MDAKQARVALDEIVSSLNKPTGDALGNELVRRFFERVYKPVKYSNGDWRKSSGEEAEGMFRRSILPEIGEMRCRDLMPEHLRAVLQKAVRSDLSQGPVNQIRFALGNLIKMMVAEKYITNNIALGLKTPQAVRRTDRTLLRRVTLPEYLRAWAVLDERERLAFDLVTFCGLRESEVYGLKISDLLASGAIRVERSFFKGTINPTKTNEIRKVGVDPEIFQRLAAWTEMLPDRSDSAWIFPCERITTPLWPDNVLRRCVYPRLEQLGLDWINFAVLRRSHSTLHKERGTDVKTIADQQGHGLGVHLSEYVETSLASKREASSRLWTEFKALRSESSVSI